jgi:hypothetical protein
MEWISVKDILPENKEMVLVSIPDSLLVMVNHVVEFSLNEYSGNHIWQTINSSHPAYTLYANVDGVTHWMPLPEPPKD